MASNSSRPVSRQPSLLDRLSASAAIDNHDGLTRDMAALLNATALSATRDLSRWPLVERSVLNYGVCGFTGRMLTNADIPEIQRNIKRTLQHFEPRLDPKSIQVTVITDVAAGAMKDWRVQIVAQRRDLATRAPIEFWAVVDAQSGQLTAGEE